MASAPPAQSAPSAAVEFHPRLLSLGGQEVLLEVELIVANASPVPMDSVKITAALISANPMQDALSGAFHAVPPAAPAAPPFDLQPEQGRRIVLRMSMPRERIHVVTIGGRTMFVPLAMIDLRWRSGLSIRHLAADFMVGTPGQTGGKLGPIWLDRAHYAGLAASLYVPRPFAEPTREPA